MRPAQVDRGTADALALVLIAPACVGLALLVTSMGRNVDTRAQARSAAESAAQAAALERDPDRARHAAERIVAEMLVDVESCASPVVDVDTSALRPGGAVAVVVECTASNRGVELVRPTGSTYSARAVAHVDPYRSGDR